MLSFKYDCENEFTFTAPNFCINWKVKNHEKECTSSRTVPFLPLDLPNNSYSNLNVAWQYCATFTKTLSLVGRSIRQDYLKIEKAILIWNPEKKCILVLHFFCGFHSTVLQTPKKTDRGVTTHLLMWHIQLDFINCNYITN